MNTLFNNMINSATIGGKHCKGVKLQDIHKAFQILLKIVKARVKFSEKLEDVRSKDLLNKKKEKEKTKAKGKNVYRAASIFRKKKK